MVPVTSVSENIAEPIRKRKRISEPEPNPESEAEEGDFDDSGIADIDDLREQIKRLKREAYERDRALEAMNARLEEQGRINQQLNQQLQLQLGNLNQYLGNHAHTSQAR